jgi:outer membrane lipopolysaccharide assembly protein LptE/RlpB
MQEGAMLLQNRMRRHLQGLSLQDAVLVTRACGHHLKLSAIAEQLHMCALWLFNCAHSFCTEWQPMAISTNSPPTAWQRETCQSCT